jgi:hypothetical protein
LHRRRTDRRQHYAQQPDKPTHVLPPHGKNISS